MGGGQWRGEERIGGLGRDLRVLVVRGLGRGRAEDGIVVVRVGDIFGSLENSGLEWNAVLGKSFGVMQGF